MKRNVRSLAFVGFVLSLALLSAGCQRQDAGRGAARSEVASPAPAKIDTAAIEAELIKLERDWAGAAKTKNGATHQIRTVQMSVYHAFVTISLE